MEITPYQIIAPIISLIAIAYAWNFVVRQKKTVWEALLWTIFWGFVIAVSLYPDLLGYLSRFTGIKDRENAVLITFLGILLFLVFYLILRVEELEQRQTKVIREIGLKEVNAKRQNHDA